jgi:DNA repair protein RecO (recombination protein O)
MSLVKDLAIVLRRLDYSETSQVLAMLTRSHGQQRLIARGVKRPAKGRAATGIDLLELGHVVFSLRPGREESLATLTEWRQSDTFPHLRRELTCCYAAQYAAEAASRLTEVHDPHPGLFAALHELLLALATADPVERLVGFLWRLLEEIGLRPELGVCMNCGREVGGSGAAYFSSREGGAICRDCEASMVEKFPVSPGTLALLAGGGPATGGQAAAAFNLLDYHLTQTLAGPLRLSGPLRNALRDAGRPLRK